LTPRRSVTLRTEIIRSYFGEDRHDSRPGLQDCFFLVAQVKGRLRLAAPTAHKARRGRVQESVGRPWSEYPETIQEPADRRLRGMFVTNVYIVSNQEISPQISLSY
jgi:hypothetical protein